MGRRVGLHITGRRRVGLHIASRGRVGRRLPWGSGRLLEWLKQRRSEQPEKKSLLRRLLYRLFTWIRRDLDVDHH